MQRDRWFEDFQVGEVRQTIGRTITETDIVVHAGHSGDFFPHHMDAEFMHSHAFGQRIAHGTMTFAIGIGLTATSINSRAFTYGYERLRFPKPVFIGDTIHTRVEVIGLGDDARRPRFGRVVEACTVLNQRGETVLYCEHVLLVEKQETSQ